MADYYNENDPYTAQWLRNLIAARHLADGVVDDRSIEEVTPDDVRGFRQCHFFAGIGGWPFALRLAGWDDNRSVWTGSLPCQPFSVAGKGHGINDERHLWPAFYGLIKECRPPTVFGEQVASKDGFAWLDHVLLDLEELGYAAAAATLCAAGVGAPHIRHRLYWVADSGRQVVSGSEPQWSSVSSEFGQAATERGSYGIHAWVHNAGDPGIALWSDGLPRPVGQVRAYGNAIVPQVAAEFIGAVMECLP